MPRRIAIAWLLAAASLAAMGAPSADEADEALARDADYVAGKEATRDGNPALGVRRLEAALVRFPDAADLHNELGYANRKLGRLDQAFKHYERALAIEPRHRGAHEYIGEAYLMVGNLAAAERHLAALRSICLLPCEELDDLRKAVEAYRSAQPKS
jgi:Flp pilus assembly protein TadD